MRLIPESWSRELRDHTAAHWHARCLTCGIRFPYAGIRYKAYGRPCQVRYCPRCRRLRCIRVEPNR